MSVKLMGAVWELELPQPEKFVLLALADHAHDDGSKCFPGVAYLAWKTGYSRRQVQRTLRALEQKAVIEVLAHDRGGRGMATEYLIRVEKGVKLSPFVKTERVTSETEKGDIHDQKGDICDQKGDAHVAPTIRTIKNLHGEPSRKAAQAAPSPDDFDMFWDQYPRKVAKQKAIQAWKKIKKSEVPVILASLEVHKKTEQWNRDGGQFIPYAATFLNGRRWEDQLDAIEGGSSGTANPTRSDSRGGHGKGPFIPGSHRQPIPLKPSAIR